MIKFAYVYDWKNKNQPKMIYMTLKNIKHF